MVINRTACYRITLLEVQGVLWSSSPIPSALPGQTSCTGLLVPPGMDTTFLLDNQYVTRLTGSVSLLSAVLFPLTSSVCISECPNAIFVFFRPAGLCLDQFVPKVFNRLCFYGGNFSFLLLSENK